MTIDSAIAPELLTAEIEAIEDLLVHYEDWRALAQLEIRERKGEVPSSVATSGLKAMLIEKLAANPLFLRRQTLLKEVERVTHSVHTPGQPITTSKRHQTDGDDLTRIRGIDARLERRLNALNVQSYEQIASFMLDDVRYVSNTLGLENRIISQMWIEQAQLLAEGDEGTPPVPSLDALRLQARAATRTATVQTSPPDVPAKADAEAKPSRGPAPKAVAPEEEALPSALNKPGAAKPVVPQALSKLSVADERPVVAAAASRSAKSSASAANPDEAEKPAASVQGAKLAAPEAGVEETPPPSVTAMVVKVEEPSRDDLVPPKSVPAAKPKGVPPEAVTAPQPATRSKSDAAAASVTAAVIPDVDEPDYSKLQPALPLPARKYAGAVFEPIDHGVLAGSPPPPKPRPAAAYLAPPAEPDPKPAAKESREPEKAPTAAPVRPVATASSQQAQDQGASRQPAATVFVESKRPADIVGQNLPPLPLRPATAASPPPPLPRTAPTAASPPASAPVSSSAAPVSGAAQAAAAAAKEAAMLAAVATRSSRPAGSVSAPPPLPAAGPLSSLAETPRSPPAASPKAKRGSQEHRSNFEDRKSSAASGEARVTIRRSEEQGTGPVIRNPGATEVHLGREQRRALQFDSNSYAAYHNEVEEASVQIVRRKDAPPKAAAVSAAVTAAGVAAKAAAAALTRKADSNVPAAPADTPSNPPPVAENTKIPIGRFLKALTGQ